MATDILLTSLTEGTLTGSGVFDKLMSAVNVHIEEQFSKSRIKDSEYATVYLGAMQTVIAESMQFVLTEKQSEAQTDQTIQQTASVLKDLDIKERQMVLSEAESAANIALIVEKTESEDFQNKVDGVLANQILGMKKDIDTKERSIVEQEATGSTSRILTTAQTNQIAYSNKSSLLTTQLGAIIDLYKNNKLDILPEIVTRETEVEKLYNSLLADTDASITPITAAEESV